MRYSCVKLLVLGLLLAASAGPMHACGEDEFPDRIKVPGGVRHAIVRGDHLLGVSNAGHILAIDLRLGKTVDLGPMEGRRAFVGDVADGQALLLARDRLQIIALATGKVRHELPLGSDPVCSLGFVGKDRAFVHRGHTLTILELPTGKVLHTIALGEPGQHGRPSAAWQKVGNRLFVPGPATTLCVIDLDQGQLLDRLSLDARAGIAALQVAGSQVYCAGSPFSWGARVDHITCVDLETKKSSLVELPKVVFRNPGLGLAPYGTVYVVEGGRLDRYSMDGTRISSYTAPGGANILAVWRYRAIVIDKDGLQIHEIKEQATASK